MYAKLENPEACHMEERFEVDHAHGKERHTGHLGVQSWVFAIIAIVLISAVGFLGVLTVPVMKMVFFTHLNMFMVRKRTSNVTDVILNTHMINLLTGCNGSWISNR